MNFDNSLLNIQQFINDINELFINDSIYQQFTNTTIFHGKCIYASFSVDASSENIRQKSTLISANYFQTYSTVCFSFDGRNTITGKIAVSDFLAASADQQKLAAHANSLLLTAILTHRTRYRKRTPTSRRWRVGFSAHVRPKESRARRP